MTSSGWIALHRRAKKSWLWLEEREFSRFEAWLDLLLRSNWDRTEGCYRGIPYHVERGELITSQESLSEDWTWSRGKVRRFLDRLVDEEMILVKTDTLGLRITICNYDKYQNTEETDGHPTDTPRTPDGHPADIPRTSGGHPADTLKQNKQIKQDKQDQQVNKREVAPCVWLADEDLEKLKTKLKSDKELRYWLGNISTYACQNPVAFKKKYKDHYRLILNWRVRRMEEGKVWDESKGLYSYPPRQAQYVEQSRPKSRDVNEILREQIGETTNG